jgi:hypothetical protein
MLDALSMAADNTNGPKRISSGRVMRFKKRSLRPAINLSNCKYEVGKDAHPALQRSSDRRRSLYISILRQGGILVAICHRLNHRMMPLLLIRALIYHLRPVHEVELVRVLEKHFQVFKHSSRLWFETSRFKPLRCVCIQSFMLKVPTLRHWHQRFMCSAQGSKDSWMEGGWGRA